MYSFVSISVVQLAQRFGLVDDEDNLADQYHDYQLSPMTELPTYKTEETRFDTFWLSMEKATLPSKQRRFDQLAKVALCALSLPHSNADPERAFSMLRKIQQDSRGNLNHETTTSLMSCKMNEDAECHQFSPAMDLLKLAKSACSAYKADHSKMD